MTDSSHSFPVSVMVVNGRSQGKAYAAMEALGGSTACKYDCGMPVTRLSGGYLLDSGEWVHFGCAPRLGAEPHYVRDLDMETIR